MPTNTKIELVKGGKRVDGTFVPNTPATGTITSDTLKPAPSFSVTQPKPATQLDGLGAMAQAGNDAFSENLKASAEETRKNADAARAQYTKALQDTPGEAQLTNTEYAKEVDPAAAELSDINQQIIEEEHAKQRRLQALDKNPQGLFGGALEQEKQRVTDESNARQADLSVIQLAKQGRYDSAVARADRAVQAKLEAQQNLIDALKVNYEDNKDLFNTAEQRSFETLLSDRNRKLDKEAADLKQISDLSLNALTNGAPASVAMQMRQAKTVEEAFAIGGQYIDALDRAAKLQSISASRTSQLLDLAKAGDQNAIKSLGFDPSTVAEEIDPVTRRQLTYQVDSTSELLDLASQYRDLIQQHGFTNRVFGDPKVLGQIDALRGQMTAKYKKAEQLGTLDNGVSKLMEQLLGEAPTSGFLDAPKNATGRPAAKLVSSLDTFINTAESSQAKAMLRLGIDPVVPATIKQDDLSEIDQILGTTPGSTTPFNPANFY